MTESEANPGGTYHERVLAFRRALIRDAIVAAGGNKSRAARVLGLQRTYLLRLVRDLDLHDALRGAAPASASGCATTDQPSDECDPPTSPRSPLPSMPR